MPISKTVLSPRAFELLIRHLDSIDQAVSKKLNRTEPWEEPMLTRFFCDLFDRQGQADEKLSYSIEQLEADLAAADEPLSVDWRISARTYTAHEENRITQSDIGLVVEYRDQFDSSRSFTTYHLLQAKRLFRSSNGRYDTNSRFNSLNTLQHDRLLQLEAALGREAVKYLLYCPRPAALAPDLRQLLTYHRARALEHEIYDYARGAALHADLVSTQPTVAAGIFVSELEPVPAGLVEIHERIFLGTAPFAWFIADQFVFRDYFDNVSVATASPAGRKPGSDEMLRRLVEADPEVIKELGIEWTDPGKLLPAQTLTLSVTASPETTRRTKGRAGSA